MPGGRGLLLVFRVFDSFFVGDDDISKAGHGLGQLAHTFVVFHLCGGDQFNGLGEGFVPFGEAFEALINGWFPGCVVVFHWAVAGSFSSLFQWPTRASPTEPVAKGVGMQLLAGMVAAAVLRDGGSGWLFRRGRCKSARPNRCPCRGRGTKRKAGPPGEAGGRPRAARLFELSDSWRAATAWACGPARAGSYRPHHLRQSRCRFWISTTA